MRRLLPLFLVLAGGAVLPVALSPSPAPSCKPTPPIDLDVRLVGDPYAPFGILATASSRTGHDVELEVVLPEGVTHLGGERRTVGKRCELRVDAQAAGRARREILVRAVIREGAAKLTRVVPLVLNDVPGVPPGTPKTNTRGEAIVEFRP